LEGVNLSKKETLLEIAIISDIHGNLEALNTALADIDARGIEEIVCLGDVVGYGANPAECIALIRARCQLVILGNHDAAAAGSQDVEYFNEFARFAVLWTQSGLADDDKTYLESLPYFEKRDGMHLVHGTPRNPERWNYIFSDYDAMDQFSAFDGDICFVGHSHVPGIYKDPEALSQSRRIINVGSIGQPRDRDPRLCFVTFDTESREVEFIRLEYDVETAAAKIRKAGLPEFLAERLTWGY
jgi:diadenosine tetraphosphatase ApaH/serine/threonine PP2A family protein phosphatase